MHPSVLRAVCALSNTVAPTPPFKDLVEEMPPVVGAELDHPLPHSAPAIEMSNTSLKCAYAFLLDLKDPFPPLLLPVPFLQVLLGLISSLRAPCLAIESLSSLGRLTLARIATASQPSGDTRRSGCESRF